MPIHLRLVVKVHECSDLIPFASHIAILIRRKLGQVFNRFIELLGRSEEHTSELQSLMRISYAVFCLKKKTTNTTKPKFIPTHLHQQPYHNTIPHKQHKPSTR